MANLINNYVLNNDGQTVGPTYGTDKQTGISKFKLSTIDEGKTIALYGLLNELPEFSFEVDYVDGPGGVWQDTLNSFFRNDITDLVNLIGADSNTGYKNMVKAGSWTKKIYNGYKPGSIPLKFRIYTTDTLGQSDPKLWIDSLTKYATINSGSTYSIQQQLYNFFSGLKNISDTGKKFGNTIQGYANIYGNKKEDNTPVKTKTDEDNEKISKYNTERQKIYKIRHTIEQCAKSFSAKPENKIPITVSFHTSFSAFQFISSFVSSEDYTLFMDVYIGNNQLIKDGNCGLDQTESQDPDKLATKESILEVLNKTDVKATVQQWEQSAAHISRQDYESLYSRFLSEVNAEVDALDNDSEFVQDPDEDTKNQIMNVDKLLGIINELGNTFIDKYGPYRVVSNLNNNNALGSKLWFLNIYDDIIFNSTHPLIVYVSDWTVKFSDESLDGTPVYYDFNLTCHLDQVYSRSQWSRILANNVIRHQSAFRRDDEKGFKSMQY